MDILEHYLNRTTRDQRFKELKARGYDVVRRSSDSIIQCEYVEDCDREHSALNGFGGCSPTYHKIYTVETR